MYLLKLKCVPLLNTAMILLGIFLLPGCLMLLVGTPAELAGHCGEEMVIKNNNLDYLDIAANWAKKNKFDVIEKTKGLIFLDKYYKDRNGNEYINRITILLYPRNNTKIYIESKIKWLNKKTD